MSTISSLRLSDAVDVHEISTSRVTRPRPGAPRGDRSQGVNMFVVHTATPETERSHFSFHNFVRNYRVRDQGLTRQIAETDCGILMEDKRILEAQQAAMERQPERDFNNLGIDSGPARMRRILERMIVEETNEELRHPEARGAGVRAEAGRDPQAHRA